MYQGTVIQKMSPKKWILTILMFVSVFMAYLLYVYHLPDKTAVWHSRMEYFDCPNDSNMKNNELLLSVYTPTLKSCERIYPVDLEEGSKNIYPGNKKDKILAIRLREEPYLELRRHLEFTNLQLFTETQQNLSSPDPVIIIPFRLAASRFWSDNKWTLLGYFGANVTAHLHCYIEKNQENLRCDPLPIFIDRLPKGDVILNFYLPDYMHAEPLLYDSASEMLSYIHLFQRVIFLPIVMIFCIWFCKRVYGLKRKATLTEYMLSALGITLAMANCPVDCASIFFVYSSGWVLWGDITKAIFMILLLAFMMVFVRKHQIIQQNDNQKNLKFYRLKKAILLSFLTLPIYHVLRELKNINCRLDTNFFNSLFDCGKSEWSPALPATYLVLIATCFGIYILLLAYMILAIYRSFDQIDQQTLQKRMASTGEVPRTIINRFKIVLIATLICAAVTVTEFFLEEIRHGRWIWNEIFILDSFSSSFVYVHGVWNFYVIALLFFYMPSSYSSECSCVKTGDEKCLSWKEKNCSYAYTILENKTNVIQN